MSQTYGSAGSLVVTTNEGEYYVIPASALAQFRATPEQKERIDQEATAQVPGSFTQLGADEASARSSYAGSSKPTTRAWFQSV